MEIPKMPSAFTPEVIEAIAKYATALKSSFSSNDEAMVLQQRCSDSDSEASCCCPRFLKFKIFGNAYIFNFNSECTRCDD